MVCCAALFVALFFLLAPTSGLSADAGSEPPSVSAAAAIVANGATGEVLHEHNADTRLPIASITKVMTALTALERVQPNETVTVGRGAVSVGEASIFLRVGEELPAGELLAAALIQSANDAAWALAAHAGDGRVRRFVSMMNENADRLGLSNTQYVRPDGLDVEGHYSSARDILKLSRLAMRKPLIRKLVRTKRAEITGGRTLKTTNDLLSSFGGTIGIKTGQTDDAGWSQVAAARREGVTMYAVVLGGPSRAQRNADLEALLEWGIEQYGRVALVQSGRTYATVEVPFSDEPLELISSDDAYRVTRLGATLTETVVAPAIAELPVKKGQTLGEVCFDHRNRHPVPASSRRRFGPRLRASARGLDGTLGALWDHAGSMLGGLFGAVF